MTELIKPGVGESLQQVFTALLDQLDVAGDFDRWRQALAASWPQITLIWVGDASMVGSLLSFGFGGSHQHRNFFISTPSFRAARCRNIHGGYIKNRQGDAPALVVLAWVTSPYRLSGWCDNGRVIPSESLPVKGVVSSSRTRPSRRSPTKCIPPRQRRSAAALVSSPFSLAIWSRARSFAEDRLT